MSVKDRLDQIGRGVLVLRFEEIRILPGKNPFQLQRLKLFKPTRVKLRYPGFDELYEFVSRNVCHIAPSFLTASFRRD